MSKLFWIAAGLFFGFIWTNIVTLPEAEAQRTLSNLEEDINALLEGVKPAIVTVEAKHTWEGEPGAKKKKIESEASHRFIGSGIIYNDKGYILTTPNVLQSGPNVLQSGSFQLLFGDQPARSQEKYQVTLGDGRSFSAELIGQDEETNLAVLKVEAANLHPARLGNSGLLKEGSWITVVGNAYGVPAGVSFGLVNGFRDDGTIQMSVNVSPGSSGGPVLNTKGEVVGLVLAKVSEPFFISLSGDDNKKSTTVKRYSEQLDLPTSGVSLAVPIDRVREVADQIIAKGKVERAYAGVYPLDLDDDTKENFDLKAGALISEVVAGGPADKAGIKEGDVVTALDGEAVKNEADFRQKMSRLKPDTKATFTVRRKVSGREDQTKEIAVTLGSRSAAAAVPARGDARGWEEFGRALGNLRNYSFNREEETLSKAEKESLQKQLEKLQEQMEKQQELFQSQMEKLQEELSRLQEQKGKE